jgi:hypothetical protein
MDILSYKMPDYVSPCIVCRKPPDNILARRLWASMVLNKVAYHHQCKVSQPLLLFESNPPGKSSVPIVIPESDDSVSLENPDVDSE